MTTTVDLLGALERTLAILRRRGWNPNGSSIPDENDAVSLVTAIEIATNGSVGGHISEMSCATMIAIATRIVVEAQRTGRPAPLMAWCMRVADPSWMGAEQLLEHWDADGARTWRDLERLLDGLIEELGAETDDAA